MDTTTRHIIRDFSQQFHLEADQRNKAGDYFLKAKAKNQQGFSIRAINNPLAVIAGCVVLASDSLSNEDKTRLQARSGLSKLEFTKCQNELRAALGLANVKSISTRRTGAGSKETTAMNQRGGNLLIGEGAGRSPSGSRTRISKSAMHYDEEQRQKDISPSKTIAGKRKRVDMDIGHDEEGEDPLSLLSSSAHEGKESTKDGYEHALEVFKGEASGKNKSAKVASTSSGSNASHSELNQKRSPSPQRQQAITPTTPQFQNSQSHLKEYLKGTQTENRNSSIPSILRTRQIQSLKTTNDVKSPESPSRSNARFDNRIEIIPPTLSPTKRRALENAMRQRERGDFEELERRKDKGKGKEVVSGEAVSSPSGQRVRGVNTKSKSMAVRDGDNSTWVPRLNTDTMMGGRRSSTKSGVKVSSRTTKKGRRQEEGLGWIRLDDMRRLRFQDEGFGYMVGPEMEGRVGREWKEKMIGALERVVGISSSEED